MDGGTVLQSLTSAQWDQRLAGIYAQSEAAEAELAELVEQRRAIALAAVSGDAAAEQALDRLNSKQMLLTTRMDALRIAAAQAGDHRREAARREAAEDQARTRAEAQEVARQLLDCTGAVDAALRSAVAALARRRALAGQLAALGHGDNRLLLTTTVSDAIAFHGFREHAELPGIGRGRRALRTADATRLSSLLPPSEVPEISAAAPATAPTTPAADPPVSAAAGTSRPPRGTTTSATAPGSPAPAPASAALTGCAVAEAPAEDVA